MGRMKEIFTDLQNMYGQDLEHAPEDFSMEEYLNSVSKQDKSKHLIDAFGEHITDGCKLSVQSLKEPVLVYMKDDGNLYFNPYGDEELVGSYFRDDLILIED